MDPMTEQAKMRLVDSLEALVEPVDILVESIKRFHESGGSETLLHTPSFLDFSPDQLSEPRKRVKAEAPPCDLADLDLNSDSFYNVKKTENVESDQPPEASPE